MEDLWIMLSNTSKHRESLLNPTILIMDPLIVVHHPKLVKLLSKFHLIVMFLKTLLHKWSLHYKEDQSQLLLMLDLYGSNSIEEVFTNITVDLNLIMVFWLLDTVLIMEPLITKLKIHGDLHGDKMDILNY